MTDKKAPAKNSPAAKAEAAAQYKYGVDYVAEQVNRKPASVRVAFRKHEVEKAEGGVYGWNNKKEVDAVIATCFPAKEEKAAKPKKSAPKKKAKSEETDSEE